MIWPALRYSADFYIWMAFCSLPTFGFCLTLLSKEGRPWARKAIENADGDPHHTDLTFLMTLTAGWFLVYAMFGAFGLAVFEGKDTMYAFWQCFGAVTVLWGVSKIEKIRYLNKFVNGGK